MTDLKRHLAKLMGWRVETLIEQADDEGREETIFTLCRPGEDELTTYYQTEEECWEQDCPDYLTSPAAMLELIKYAAKQWFVEMDTDLTSGAAPIFRFRVHDYGMNPEEFLRSREANLWCSSEEPAEALAEAIGRATGWEE